jgi:hypothetical protein
MWTQAHRNHWTVDIYNTYVFDTPSGSQKIATLDNNMAFKMQLWPLVYKTQEN